MTNQPLVSVVMTGLNNGKFLSEAIESVLNQTYQNFEFLIINDGSTDNTDDIISSFIPKDSRIQYINNETNLGQSKSRNKAIKLAKGKYIAIVDSDDICMPMRFEKQVEYMESNPGIGVLGTNFYTFFDNPGEHQDGYVHKNAFKSGRVPVHNPTCMIRKELFEKYGFFNPSYDNAEDVELYFRFFKWGVKFYNLKDRLYKYRISHGNNVSTNHLKDQTYKLLKINLRAIFLHRIFFTLSGYLYVLEQIAYFIFLQLQLNKLITKMRVRRFLKNDN